ncbi:DNA/RNA non-specific endonuclease [Xylanimonas allomyrinae]|uniref:DNA/RNA non-specific endonuclease n=1 Tax=Xylanimonas allomyrinae TaxID=2509459 RepID=A0A4P6ENC6_9MICO|nr:DNA/RNA non-specific endonuclease [Xylanimonas allomyrinae]QAY63916.1 DNA/RNA non-specific endonuclease [Xylanimonas allomyrinae]
MTGYDTAFLGIAVPLPRPRDGRPLRRLDHLHFTVLLDPARRLAAATAVGIDGGRLRPLPRTGSWRFDRRAPESEQAGPELYHRNELDRGHLVRRRDPMWGTTAEAKEAGEATFVYANAVPQVGRFNQSKELWNGLEDHVLTYAQAHERRVVVLTGPVLAPDDPVYRGVGIPRRFWKVAAWTVARWHPAPDGGPIRQDAVLAATAFVLDQTPLLDDAELARARAQALAADDAPPLGPFRTFQVSVAQVAALTGLDLGPLPDADVRGAVPAAVGVPPAWTVLTGPGDIML